MTDQTLDRISREYNVLIKPLPSFVNGRRLIDVSRDGKLIRVWVNDIFTEQENVDSVVKKIKKYLIDDDTEFEKKNQEKNEVLYQKSAADNEVRSSQGYFINNDQTWVKVVAIDIKEGHDYHDGMIGFVVRFFEGGAVLQIGDNLRFVRYINMKVVDRQHLNINGFE